MKDHTEESVLRRQAFLRIGLYAALPFVGLLRESLILPDLGDRPANLLAACLPFLGASICLGRGAKGVVKPDDEVDDGAGPLEEW